MEVAMPLMFLAMYSYWWKAAFKPRDETPSVIVLMPEDGVPGFTSFAEGASEPAAGYQG